MQHSPKLLTTATSAGVTHPAKKKKGIQRYTLAHWKLVKRRITHSILVSGLTKSCIHLVMKRFTAQAERRRSSGFPFHVINEVVGLWSLSHRT
ncbi:unnamed protein product [Ixodes pacificus]